MVTGYVNGFFNTIFYDEDVKFPMILIAASELAFGLIVYVFRFLLRNRLDFVYYLIHIILPELLYTIVITIVLYRVILAISRFVDGLGKRGEGQVAE